jgi:anti-sigma regulatory factor (Ser/Thr protein kinase)
MNAGGPDACVSLMLTSRPETLRLVRTMLSGFADAVSLDPELLDDMKTAVSEACNNVVLHAYGDGEQGPLEVTLRLDEDRVVAEVRDEGVGIDELRLLDDAEVGLGIPVIRALTEDSELRRRDTGGTEVTMCFTASRGGARLYTLPGAVAADDDFLERLSGDAVASVSPPIVVGAVLGRLARALAASAHFSLDRFSDVYLVTDALADEVGELSAGGRLSFALATGAKRLEVVVGPLLAGSGTRLRAIPREHGRPSPLELLSDELRTRPVNGEGEVLEVVMLDRRNP